MGFSLLIRLLPCFSSFLYMCQTGLALYPQIGLIYPGFQTTQSERANTMGKFLTSKNSEFALTFYTSLDVQLFLLVVIHLPSSTVIWTANRGLLVKNSDKFIFNKTGNVFLESESGLAWSTNTTGQKVKAIELKDSGNLVLLDEREMILWQSFSHPTDALISGQIFREGMRLKSFPKSNGLSHFLEFSSGDVVLSIGFNSPQIYWSILNETRKSNNSVQGKVESVSLGFNSWNFFDSNGSLLWQFVFSESKVLDPLWAVILGSDGSISFRNLHKGKDLSSEVIKIPQDSCHTPEYCGPYSVCSFGDRCQCPSSLISKYPDCQPPNLMTCNSSNGQMLYLGEKLDYFALGFVFPSLKTNLNACKEACLTNCSCLVLFFENTSGTCFMFDQIGSLQRAEEGTTGYVSYMKIGQESEERKNSSNHLLIILPIVIVTIIVLAGLLYLVLRHYRKRKRILGYKQDSYSLGRDNFLESFSSGMISRFTYADLCQMTRNFTSKIGQGGFGSVYKGVHLDGTQLAVKKLEGIGQGEKEFRSEVSIIGGIHHVHLVKLKGFCAEGSHRLLVYEYLAKGSLDKWIFKTINKDGKWLDWDKRFNIALGTAKGLAYLHEDCEVKIVHCDIKPENVLLDENFQPKVSDFGLAKLMNREQSLVYTTLRGTRGYLAPEWITNYAISEKSDVYSYGLVLLEIIGGRKNYHPEDTSEKANFPSYAFKMLEEGTMEEIVDPGLEVDKDDERVVTAVKVALWCIQDDKNLRPPMKIVVQMLEGICVIPTPPVSSHHSSLLRWSGGDTKSSGQMDYWSDVHQSECRLSGPR